MYRNAQSLLIGVSHTSFDAAMSREPSPATTQGGSSRGGPPGAELLTPDETAQRLRLAKQALARWRVEGKGPAFVRLDGNRIAYRADDIEAWLAGRRFHSTAEADRTA